MQQKLPEDLASFYEQYAEAFVVTRTLPLHLWDIKTMKDWYNKMRYTYPYPIRFLRFADYWDMKATQFALWKPNPELENWIVVTTDIGQLDDHYDEIGFKDYYKVGDSFSEWLNDWIARDGLPDPFMKIGSEGGIIDPV